MTLKCPAVGFTSPALPPLFCHRHWNNFFSIRQPTVIFYIQCYAKKGIPKMSSKQNYCDCWLFSLIQNIYVNKPFKWIYSILKKTVTEFPIFQDYLLSCKIIKNLTRDTSSSWYDQMCCIVSTICMLWRKLLQLIIFSETGAQSINCDTLYGVDVPMSAQEQCANKKTREKGHNFEFRNPPPLI